MSDSGTRILYLSRADIISLNLSIEEIINELEVAFAEKAEGRVEMPPKPGVHPGEGDNFIHAMPAYIPAMKSAGVKWVSGFPLNQEKGLPYISGLLILNDPDTGLPISVMDCVWITAKRTGAATAI
ncbi:MAG: ornithine cyclodeaminase family protein, partial [Candidatus Thorarchaeota archaeon]